jgi:hypothetical protein
MRSIDQPHADKRARPLRRRREMMARPARVRMRRRKPWVRLRRRLLGWNVRLLTEELPHLRSARQIGYGADTARIAGGAGRWQRPLGKRPSNGTGRRQTGQTDAMWPDADVGADANLGGINVISTGSVAPHGDSWSLSRPHAEQYGEYRRLACTPCPRLLASRFASQFPDSCRRRQPVVRTFVHTLWISVWKQEWKQERSQRKVIESPECRRGSAKVQTTADLCFAYPGPGTIGPARTHEDCGVTRERTF